MKTIVIAVGRVKDAAWSALYADYCTRLKRYGAFEHVEIKSEEPKAMIEAFKRYESGRCFRVGLEVEGKSMSSQGLAGLVQRELQARTQSMIFAIGGAYGFDESVRKLFDFKLSLSSLTLPHRLARLMLFEQLYRARTILAGEPYAHED